MVSFLVSCEPCPTSNLCIILGGGGKIVCQRSSICQNYEVNPNEYRHKLLLQSLSTNSCLSVENNSSDGHEFLLSRKAAEQSGTIRSMLSSGKFMESGTGKIVFKEIKGKILEKVNAFANACLPKFGSVKLTLSNHDICIQVIQYFYYKTKYAKATTPPEFEIEPSIALELLIAANYLEV